MKTEIDAAGMSHTYQVQINKLATELLEIETDTTHRHEVANIVRKHGFAAFVGGHHVAVHPANNDGECDGERLAVITHTSPDFN